LSQLLKICHQSC